MRRSTLLPLLFVLLFLSYRSFGAGTTSTSILNSKMLINESAPLKAWDVSSVKDHGELSVVVSEFFAQYDNVNNMMQIFWTTQSEHNSYMFVIERSGDNVSFTAIGEVKGAENSDYAMDYSFTDTSPLTGINYYRLKHVGFDYTYAYVQTISVEGGVEEVVQDVSDDDKTKSKNKNKNKNWITVCPNPVSDAQFLIKFGKALEQVTEITIQNPQGNVIQRISVSKGTTELTINTPDKKGNYVIKAVINGEVLSQRIAVKY